MERYQEGFIVALKELSIPAHIICVLDDSVSKKLLQKHGWKISQEDTYYSIKELIAEEKEISYEVIAISTTQSDEEDISDLESYEEFQINAIPTPRFLRRTIDPEEKGLTLEVEIEIEKEVELGFDDSIVQHKKATDLKDYTFKKLFLDPEIKSEVDSIINNIKNDTPSRVFSIILDGPPGVGKTVLAHTIAQKLNYDFVYSCAADFAQKYSGEAPRIIRDIFSQTAKLNKPTIIFIDELEAIAGNAQVNKHTNEFKNACRSLWTKMDAYQENKNIILIVAVNEYTPLPEQLKSRFEKHLIFKLPTKQQRRKMMMYFVEEYCDLIMNKEVLSYFESSLVGLAGRDIQKICKEHPRGVTDEALMLKIINKKRREKGLNIAQSLFDSWTSKKSWSDWYVNGGVSQWLHNGAIVLDIYLKFTGSDGFRGASNAQSDAQ